MKMIVAHSINGVIGKNGQIPWHLPSDMRFFKKVTEGHTVVMGRMTYESIGRPLPNRENIVLTRNKDMAYEGVTCLTNVDDVKRNVATSRPIGSDVFIIGGEKIYSHFLSEVNTIYVTLVEAVVAGDTYFPRLSTHWDVELIEVHHTRPNERLRGPWYAHRMYRLTRT